MPGLAPLALAAVWTFAQAAADPAWPSSAGSAPPPTIPTKFRDPRARIFNPPAGRYRLPDGTIQQADPPRGFYDPPPGQYPAMELPLDKPPPGTVLGPLPTAEGSMPAWHAKRTRLRVWLGLSTAVIGIGSMAPLVGLAIWRAAPYGECIDCYPPGTILALVLVPAGIIATVVSGARLGVHNRRRPVPLRVQMSPGGLRLSF